MADDKESPPSTSTVNASTPLKSSSSSSTHSDPQYPDKPPLSSPVSSTRQELVHQIEGSGRRGVDASPCSQKAVQDEGLQVLAHGSMLVQGRTQDVHLSSSNVVEEDVEIEGDDPMDGVEDAKYEPPQPIVQHDYQELPPEDPEDDDDYDDGEEESFTSHVRDYNWVVKEPIEGGPRDGSVIPSFLGHVGYQFLRTPRTHWRGVRKCQNRHKLAASLKGWLPCMPSDGRELVHNAGLSHIPDCMHVHIDAALITAFVERWQPDTNSFHLPVGEMTIMLHDVEYIMGLPVDGSLLGPVGKAKKLDDLVDDLWEHDEEMLVAYNGYKSYPKNMRMAGQVKWFLKRDYLRQARGWTTMTLSCLLFTDKSGNRFKPRELLEASRMDKVDTYSWGSATLAFLYRQLGTASRAKTGGISGCLSLLQTWIYEYFPSFRPKKDVKRHVPLAAEWSSFCNTNKCEERLWQIRKQLDELTPQKVHWEPYAKMEGHTYNRLTWYRGLIGYRDIIEFYMPDRCVRQLGYVQNIPPPIPTPQHVYRGEDIKWYALRWGNKRLISDWDQRFAKLYGNPNGRRCKLPGQVGLGYWEWYRKYCMPSYGLATAGESSHGASSAHFDQSSESVWLGMLMDEISAMAGDLIIVERAMAHIPELQNFYRTLKRMLAIQQAYQSSPDKPRDYVPPTVYVPPVQPAPRAPAVISASAVPPTEFVQGRRSRAPAKRRRSSERSSSHPPPQSQSMPTQPYYPWYPPPPYYPPPPGSCPGQPYPPPPGSYPSQPYPPPPGSYPYPPYPQPYPPPHPTYQRRPSPQDSDEEVDSYWP